MHKIEQADPIWQPMVVGSYIFPTVAHDPLAYSGAQNLKIMAGIGSKYVFDQDSLTRGVILLVDPDLLEAKSIVDPCGAAAGRCFLQTIRTILFGGGRPRYAQTPPIGGILLCDLVKAGAMILHAGDDRKILLPFEDTLRDKSYSNIYHELHQRWATDAIQWTAISATIFDIHTTTNSKATTVTATLLDMEI